MKCYYVKLLSLYSMRVLHGYKCDLESIRKDLLEAYVLSRIEDNVSECFIDDQVLYDIQKFKHKLDSNYTNICKDCESA